MAVYLISNHKQSNLIVYEWYDEQPYRTCYMFRIIAKKIWFYLTKGHKA